MKRPDIYTIMYVGDSVKPTPAYIDVGIICPSAPSYRSLPPLAQTNRYAKSKVEKYRQIAESRDAVILPLILESNGGYGNHAVNLLNDIARNAGNQAAMASPKDVVSQWQDELAIAIQKYNAMAILHSAASTAKHKYQKRTLSTQHRRAPVRSMSAA